MVRKYTPKQKNNVFLDFDLTKGNEQKSYRPAKVISNNIFNKNTKMAFLCPITSNEKEFPTHYLLQDSKKIKESVLCKHIRSVDYETRNLKYIERMSEDDFNNVINLLEACLER